MEFLLEIIFEIFGEVLDATEEIYSLKKTGRKWKVLINLISIVKIIFFSGAALLFLLITILGLDDVANSGIARVLMGFVTALFAWCSYHSIKAYINWRRRIKESINEKRASLENEADYYKNPLE